MKDVEQQVLHCFQDGKAVTRSYIERVTGVHYYIVDRTVEKLIQAGKIKTIPSSTKGKLLLLSNMKAAKNG